MDRAALVYESLQQIQRLRASGPTTIDYLRWRDRTEELLTGWFGADAAAVVEFREAVGARAPQDAEGLQIPGEHGMLQRLARAERHLRSLVGATPDPSA